jgi:DNA primase
VAVSRQQLDDIRARADVVELVREAVPGLKQTGARWRGLCPFHQERTPSFYVMPEKGLWHCFGACQEGGDVFKFVMRREGITFPEAIRHMAQRAGVRLEWEKSGDASDRAARERDELAGLLEEAAVFYTRALGAHADAETARRYAVERKIRPETSVHFRLGYAPPRGSFLDDALKKGVPIETLVKAGLAVRSERSARYHDPQGGRLVFPIRDAYGQVVGFGGRVLEEGGGPKYLNSPETPLFSKGRLLYGLYEGRKHLRDKGQALVVEGYMDVVACHQAGITRAVAPLGTAFTPEQGRLLKRYVQEAVLLFDPDEAGRRAVSRTAEALLAEDVFVRVAGLPGEMDPDEFVLAQGAPALEALLSGAADVVDYWLDRLEESSKGLDPLHGRVRRAEAFIQFLRGVPNELLRREWIKRAARRLSLEESVLRRKLDGSAPPAPRPGPRRGPAAPSAPEKIISAEEELIQLFFAHPELGKEAVEIPPAHFADLRCRGLFERLCGPWRAGGRTDAAALLAELGPADANWLSSLLVEDKRFEDPPALLARSRARLVSQSAARERRLLEKDVLDMVEGRRPRDEARIALYQDLVRSASKDGP